MPAHFAVVLILCGLIASGCSPPPTKTVPGPETDQLLATTTGHLVKCEAGGAIIGIELPSLRETIVRPAAPDDAADRPTIHALSGPDRAGRIAYIEDHFSTANDKDQRHLLKIVQLDGTRDTEIFTHQGDALWADSPAGNGGIGRHLALSPVGGQVALLSHISPVQMPGAYLEQGAIEIWDVTCKKNVLTEISALDDGFAWLPDGKHLAYVKLADVRAITTKNVSNDSFGSMFQTWEKVPAVYVRDLETQTETFVHIGSHPIVSADGQTLVLSDYQGAWEQIDLATGTSITVSCPGGGGGIIASFTSDVKLCWAYPTQGTQVSFTTNYSPLVGAQQMLAIKLVRLNSDQFQTVVPTIDPRAVVSFGQVDVPK